MLVLGVRHSDSALFQVLFPYRLLQIIDCSSLCYTVGTCWLFVFYVWIVLSCFHCVQLFAAPWTIAFQAPLSMGFCRQEYRSGLPCPSPGDLLGPGIEPASLTSPALSGGFSTTSATWEAHLFHRKVCTVNYKLLTYLSPLSPIW